VDDFTLVEGNLAFLCKSVRTTNWFSCKVGCGVRLYERSLFSGWDSAVACNCQPSIRVTSKAMYNHVGILLWLFHPWLEYAIGYVL
jgi:hypothetical protein